MPKTITSSSKRWPGHVILHDPLNYDMVSAIDEAREEAYAIKPSNLLSRKDKNGKIIEEFVWSASLDGPRVDAIVKCVAEWHLNSGFPEKPDKGNFPMSPRNGPDNANDLVTWLWDEIYKVYTGEIEIPNAS